MVDLFDVQVSFEILKKVRRGCVLPERDKDEVGSGLGLDYAAEESLVGLGGEDGGESILYETACYGMDNGGSNKKKQAQYHKF